MTRFDSLQPMAASGQKSWRHDAVAIVEDLFQVTAPESWNLLLDLREGLLQGTDWDRALDVFLACREELEAAHYLPFYRMRRLLSDSLKLEAGVRSQGSSFASLTQILRRKHRSLADIRRAVSREMFEQGVDADEPLVLRVVER